MPDYRFYGLNENGEMVEQPPEAIAKLLGIAPFDANLMLKGANITKAICMTVGLCQSPPLVWNKNMPGSLVTFVTDHVYEQLTANPAWELQYFNWSLLYEKDGTLKYKD